MKFGPHDYLQASLERLAEAQQLYGDSRYVGCLYLAGVAVEALLLAYHLRRNRAFEARHDLAGLAKDSGLLEFVPIARRAEIAAHLGDVWERWKNNYRYAGDARLRSEFRRIGLARGIKGDYVKKSAQVSLEAALAIVAVGVERFRGKIHE